MFSNSILEFFIFGIFFSTLILILIKGFGLFKIHYANLKWLQKIKQLTKDTDDTKKKEALLATINHCQNLNSKWLLEESDLKFLNNTLLLIKKIAYAYHPSSQTPIEEARIRSILNAFIELKTHFLILTTHKGIQAITQFRIRHILILSRAWKAKESLKQSKIIFFLDKHGLYPLLGWLFFIIRCLDLTFWAMKMTSYILQDIVLKVFLVRWYLVVGELANQVYSDKDVNSEIPIESILDGLDDITEPENLSKDKLPKNIKEISETSRNEILYHTWSVEWVKVRSIYINLINSIAQEYHPDSDHPVYEVKLFDLLTTGLYLSEQIAAIQNYPFVNKILDLRVSHALMTKDATSFLMNSQVLFWVNKHKLGYIFKYSLLLFKVIQKKHPALLFKDFAFTLAGEGCKRWLYLYLHDRITEETNMLYKTS
jgi:hypothetical protein